MADSHILQGSIEVIHPQIAGSVESRSSLLLDCQPLDVQACQGELLDTYQNTLLKDTVLRLGHSELFIPCQKICHYSQRRGPQTLMHRVFQ